MDDLILKIKTLVPDYVNRFDGTLTDDESVRGFFADMLIYEFIFSPELAVNFAETMTMEDYKIEYITGFITVVQLLGEYNAVTGNNFNWQDLLWGH